MNSHFTYVRIACVCSMAHEAILKPIESRHVRIESCHVWASQVTYLWMVCVCSMVAQEAILKSVPFCDWWRLQVIRVCDMTHSHVWHFSSHVCDLPLWHDSFMSVACRIHVCDTTHSDLWHNSFKSVKHRIHMCDTLQSQVRHKLCICVTRHIHIIRVTFICVTQIGHIRHDRSIFYPVMISEAPPTTTPTSHPLPLFFAISSE